MRSRLALVLAALAAPASAASIDWRVDPVTGAVIGLTGERVDPLDAVRPRRAPLTKGEPLPEPHSLGDYWFTCPAWRGVEWVMLTEVICATPRIGDTTAAALTYEPPPLWLSGRLTETRVGEPTRWVPPLEPEGPARVPGPPALVLLTAAVAAMWRMR